MARNKVQVFHVKSANGEAKERLIKGTLRQVESRLRYEWEINPATPEQTHAMADVELEDATGEP